MSFKFEKLIVYQKALDLSDNIFELAKKFPKEETYVLKSQIQRAADSVSLNIAEGTTGVTKKEFYNFIGYSIRSAIEVVGCLNLAKRRKYINDEEFSKLYNQIVELVKMLQSFRKSLNETDNKKTDV
jgi:four helix bundle protein